MALVFQLNQGEDFYVDHEQVIVQAIISPREFILHRVRDGKNLTFREGRVVEMFDNVHVSVGARGQSDSARIVIEAPRSISLLRGENYRANPPSRSANG